jgi:ketosteroid isomerase-like protein
MSQENVEIVRSHIEAFRAEDAPGSFSFLDPHVVLDVSRAGQIDSEAYYGYQAVAAFVRRYVGTFEDYEYNVKELTDLGTGAVLAVVTEKGRGKGSGVPVNRSYAVLYTVIDGRIARITQFGTEQEALEAAGLQE